MSTEEKFSSDLSNAEALVLLANEVKKRVPNDPLRSLNGIPDASPALDLGEKPGETRGRVGAGRT